LPAEALALFSDIARDCVLDRDSEGHICSDEAFCVVEVVLGVRLVTADSIVFGGRLDGVEDGLSSMRIGDNDSGVPFGVTLDGMLELVYLMDGVLLVFIRVVQFLWTCPKVGLFSLHGKQSWPVSRLHDILNVYSINQRGIPEILRSNPS
jgi:hypothetical protein